MDCGLPCPLSCHGKVMLVVCVQQRGPKPCIANAWSFYSRSGAPLWRPSGLLFGRVNNAPHKSQGQQGRRHSGLFGWSAQLALHKTRHVQSHICIGYSRAACLFVFFQYYKVPLDQQQIPTSRRVFGHFGRRGSRLENVTDVLRHDHSSMNGSLLPCKGVGPVRLLVGCTVSPSPPVIELIGTIGRVFRATQKNGAKHMPIDAN